MRMTGNQGCRRGLGMDLWGGGASDALYVINLRYL